MRNLFDNEYYDDCEVVKEKLYSKINSLNEKNIRFLYIVASNLEGF